MFTQEELKQDFSTTITNTTNASVYMEDTDVIEMLSKWNLDSSFLD